jgi:transglutaminase-like putative cysteine protease
MTVLFVRHRTEYQYRQPVLLSEHRLMSRPRDSHDLRLLDTALTVTPAPSELRWLHDVFGNSIAVTTFSDKADSLIIESTFRAEHYPLPEQTIHIEPYAQQLPFNYSGEDSADLERTKERQYPDPEHLIDQWAKFHVDATPERNTLNVLIGMCNAIRNDFRYLRREEEGVQTPVETLKLMSGSCRDFAVFMMEAVRSIGLAARFVSGYLYDEKLISADNRGLVGWVEFDPTNALVGGRNLIRVAVARNASQAAPLAGSFIGVPGDCLSMNVTVEVTAE